MKLNENGPNGLMRIGQVVLVLSLVLGHFAVAELESDAAIIETTYQAWEEATNAKDIKLWATFLAPNPMFMPADAPPLDTREAILDYYRASFADPNFSLDCQQLSVDVADSNEMAWATGVCRATFSDASGDKAAGASRWFKVWLKQDDGSWKCRVNVWDYVNSAD